MVKIFVTEYLGLWSPIWENTPVCDHFCSLLAHAWPNSICSIFFLVMIGVSLSKNINTSQGF